MGLGTISQLCRKVARGNWYLGLAVMFYAWRYFNQTVVVMLTWRDLLEMTGSKVLQGTEHVVFWQYWRVKLVILLVKQLAIWIQQQSISFSYCTVCAPLWGVLWPHIWNEKQYSKLKYLISALDVVLGLTLITLVFSKWVCLAGTGTFEDCYLDFHTYALACKMHSCVI